MQIVHKDVIQNKGPAHKVLLMLNNVDVMFTRILSNGLEETWPLLSALLSRILHYLMDECIVGYWHIGITIIITGVRVV